MDVNITSYIQTHTLSHRADTYFATRYFLVLTRTYTHTYVSRTCSLFYSFWRDHGHMYTPIFRTTLTTISANVFVLYTPAHRYRYNKHMQTLLRCTDFSLLVLLYKIFCFGILVSVKFLWSALFIFFVL